MSNIKIIDQDHYGRGIAKLDGKIVFVEKALPGDIVDIEIIENKKNFNVAKVIKYHNNSIKQELCDYYNYDCGGCNLLHQDYKNQLLFKQNKVANIINKFLGKSIKINDIVYEKQFNYRNKITLHDLGLFRGKSNDSIKIKRCCLIDENINKVIERLNEISMDFEKVVIRTSNQNQVLLDIEGNVDRNLIYDKFNDIDVLIVNNVPLTNETAIIDVIDDLKFRISSKSFYQVNRFLTSRLYNKVIGYVKDKNIDKSLDLYCGTGTITLMLSKYVKSVIGIELVDDAILDANRNKIDNNISNATFICGKVEDNIESFKDIDLIVVDPPRSGLDNKTISYIKDIKPNMLIYVSCDPMTLARDLKLLNEKYAILEITPFDMFPNTYHVECVCVLNRR